MRHYPAPSSLLLSAPVNYLTPSGVALGTDAAARGIATGDVIWQVQDQAVTSEAEIQSVLEEARRQGHDYAMFLVLSKVPVHPEPGAGPKWVALQSSSEMACEPLWACQGDRSPPGGDPARWLPAEGTPAHI